MTYEEETEWVRRCGMKRLEELCAYLIPGGRRSAHWWRAGDINGSKGQSFDVNLRSGCFGDWATGESKGKGPIDLWLTVRGLDFKEARDQLAGWLGITLCLQPNHAADRTEPRPKAEPPPDRKEFLLPELEPPSAEDLTLLAAKRTLYREALSIAVKREFLWCFDDDFGERCWLFTDQRRRCAIRRRLDGKPFKLANGNTTKAAAAPGSIMTEPLGYIEAKDFQSFSVVEGPPDGLSVISLAWASDLDNLVAPIVMPCTSARFTPEALRALRGKRGRLFVDGDQAGKKAVRQWFNQLSEVDIKVDLYCFAGLRQNDGSPVKDLNDFCRLDPSSWTDRRSHWTAIMDFCLERNT